MGHSGPAVGASGCLRGNSGCVLRSNLVLIKTQALVNKSRIVQENIEPISKQIQFRMVEDIHRVDHRGHAGIFRRGRHGRNCLKGSWRPQAKPRAAKQYGGKNGRALGCGMRRSRPWPRVAISGSWSGRLKRCPNSSARRQRPRGRSSKGFPFVVWSDQVTVGPVLRWHLDCLSELGRRGAALLHLSFLGGVLDVEGGLLRFACGLG